MPGLPRVQRWRVRGGAEPTELETKLAQNFKNDRVHSTREKTGGNGIWKTQAVAKIWVLCFCGMSVARMVVSSVGLHAVDASWRPGWALPNQSWCQAVRLPTRLPFATYRPDMHSTDKR